MRRFTKIALSLLILTSCSKGFQPKYQEKVCVVDGFYSGYVSQLVNYMPGTNRPYQLCTQIDVGLFTCFWEEADSLSDNLSTCNKGYKP